MEAQARSAVVAGLIAGAVGGVVLAVYLVILAAVQSLDIWATLKVAGAPLLRTRALQPGFDPVAVLVGFSFHLAVSAFWGLLFGVLFYGRSRTATLVAGAFWGLITWVGMYYIVLPIAGLGEMSMSAPIAPTVAAHLVFGLAVGIAFQPFQRRDEHHSKPGEAADTSL